MVGGAVARAVVVGLLVLAAAFLTDQLGGSPTALLVLAVVLPVLWLAAELLLPRTTVLGEWCTLLHHEALAADAVFAGTFRSLRDHHALPCLIGFRRVRVGGPAPGLRNVLRIHLGRYTATVAVFPFGNDLHIGWTLVRRQIPLVTAMRWLVSLVAVDNGYVDLIEVEPAKALGEAVQQAVQAGIDSAPEGVGLPLAATFGVELAVEEADHRSSA